MGRLFKRLIVGAFLLSAVLVVAVVIISRGQRQLNPNTELAAGKIRIAVDGFIAAYVVELADGNVALIDAGMDTSAEEILRVLRQQGKARERVQAIFLTHGHGDHIGGALAFPRADVYALEEDADLAEGRRVANNTLGKFRSPSPTGIAVARGLQDGERVRVGGTTFEVFAVPGHTLGSAAYLVHGVLFLGDSAAARSDGRIAPAPPVFSADRETNQASLRQLAARLEGRQGEIEWLAFGHQGPLRGLGPLLQWAGR